MCEEGGRWFLAGITSFGFGCGRRNRPGVFTAVAPYEAWIREQVMGSEPGPAFPIQPQGPQSGAWEPMDENCTIALPGEVAGPQMSARRGRWDGKCRRFKGPADPGLSSFRVREGPAARGLALGGSGDGARIQTLPWDAGV